MVFLARGCKPGNSRACTTLENFTEIESRVELRCNRAVGGNEVD